MASIEESYSQIKTYEVANREELEDETIFSLIEFYNLSISMYIKKTH